MSAFGHLRRNLTALNAVVSAVILVCIAAGALVFTTHQLSESAENAFAHAADSIVHQLDANQTISHSHLFDTEVSQGMLIYMENGGAPLQWRGALSSQTPRSVLIDRARALAIESALPLEYAPISPRNLLSTLPGGQGESYRVSIWVLPDAQSYSTVIVLKDMADERAMIRRTIWAFAACTLLGIAAQFAFSSLFARRAMRPIEQADREQRAFIQAASHELRTPLAVIGASADAVSKADPQEALIFTDAIRQQSRHMAKLVDDMLMLASADAQSLPISLAPVEIDRLLESTQAAFAPLMREKGLEFACAPIPPRVLWADEARLMQLLSVLLDNAAEYTPRGGRVSIGCHAHKGSLEIFVEDNGPGIPDELKAHVFDRFYRADKARSNAKAHYGLGLCVAKEIASLHHGQLTSDNSPLGGARFTLYLPEK